MDFAEGRAMITYDRRPGVIRFLHTEVPDLLQGQGIAAGLARFVLAFSRDAGLEVLPLCPYVKAYIERHPDWRDVVSPGFDWSRGG